MSQKQSPWLESAYGWDFGESNWNTGIDQNQLKFSFMFDRNVDGVVASLPAAINGQAYFLTTDNRLYFAVGTTWFSTPTPKWFQFTVRSTGAIYQFNGTSAVQIDSPTELDARLGAVEITIASLGTAAFEDTGFFATQAALDIVEGSAQAYADGVGVASNDYTDVLRQDLASEAGAALVGTTSALSGAIATTAAAGITLYIPAGTYRIDAYADGSVIRGESGLHMVCHPDARFVLHNDGGYNVTAFFEHSLKERITYEHLYLDANHVAGANVFGANNVSKVRIVGGRFTGGVRKPSGTFPGGGRGITFQFNCQDILVENPIVWDCTSGIDFHGRQTNRLYNVTVQNPTISNCEEALSFYDLFDNNADLETGGDVQVNVVGGTVFNCGLATDDTVGGTATGTEGGVIVSERARSFSVRGLSIYNESAYGTVGGIFRGTGANFFLSDITAYASVVAPINLSPATNLLPVTPGSSIQIIAPVVDGLALHGSCEYGVFHDNGGGANSLFQGVLVGLNIPTPSVALVNAIVASRGGTLMEFHRGSDGAVVQGFSDKIGADILSFVGGQITNGSKVEQRHGLNVSVNSALDQLRLERRGTSAGVGRVWANNAGVTIGNDAFTAALTVDTVGATRDVTIPSSSFSAGRFKLGNYYLWVDATGALRIKAGEPTVDLDGTVVGTQS
jgi:hypothetical protein